SAATFRLKETAPFTRETAARIAEQITERVKTTGPFRNWEQFHEFCDSLTDTVGLAKAEADVLKANFNPNTNLNDFNPDYNRLLRVDKTDLAYHTTEFTFYPTGYYKITSLGRVLNKNNKVVAEAEISASVKLFDIYRETAQSQFLADLKAKSIDNIIAKNTNPTKPTNNNLTLQVLPEINNKEAGLSADYDGYITLATTEQSNPALGGSTLRFRASFTNGLDANTGQEIKRFRTEPVPDAGRLIPASETASAIAGRLYPDGVYSDSKAIPAYDITPPTPIDNQLMIVSMWIKPHFYPEETGKIRTYFSWMNITADNETYGRRGIPFGIYSIARLARNDIASYRAEGDGWNHNSFLAGGYGSQYRIGFTGAGTPCLNHVNHPSCSGTPDNWPNAFQAGKWLNVVWVRRVMESSAMIDNNSPLKYAFSGNKLYVFADGISYQKERLELATCAPPRIRPDDRIKHLGPILQPIEPPKQLDEPKQPEPPADLGWPETEPPDESKPPEQMPPIWPPPQGGQSGNDTLYINGQAWQRGAFQDQNATMTGRYDDVSNYLRLGEVASALRLNGAPDATIDEVLIFELAPTSQGSSINPPSDRKSAGNDTFIIEEKIKLCSLNNSKVTHINKEKIIWAACPGRWRPPLDDFRPPDPPDRPKPPDPPDRPKPPDPPDRPKPPDPPDRPKPPDPPDRPKPPEPPAIPDGIDILWNTGRYYTGDDARFTSSEINLDAGGNPGSENTDPLNIFMVHWTVYGTKSKTDNGTMPDGKVDVELSGRILAIPSDGGAVAPAESGPLTLRNGSIKYELLFKPNTTLNQPANDTIIFDDITFYYYTAPKIINWEYEQ
ncbi:MAG: hypothetical protein AB1599_09655, partial [Planctomycetota bacterium]